MTVSSEIADDVNFTIFNMATKINKPKPWTKHISREWKCRIWWWKMNLNEKCYHDNCQFECRKSIKHYVLHEKMPEILVHMIGSVINIVMLMNI